MRQGNRIPHLSQTTFQSLYNLHKIPRANHKFIGESIILVSLIDVYKTSDLIGRVEVDSPFSDLIEIKFEFKTFLPFFIRA